MCSSSYSTLIFNAILLTYSNPNFLELTDNLLELHY